MAGQVVESIIVACEEIIVSLISNRGSTHLNFFDLYRSLIERALLEEGGG